MRLTTILIFIGVGFAISAHFTRQQAQVSCFIALSINIHSKSHYYDHEANELLQLL